MVINKYIPELEIAFNNYWRSNAEITLSNVPLSSTINNSIMISDTIFELLFNNNYSYSNFNYLLKEIQILSLEKQIRERLRYSRSLIKVYITDSTNGTDNIFSISNNDLTILNMLVDYRKNIIPNISLFNYVNSSNLSKLIYIYLDLMINNNYQKIEDMLVSSSNNILESLFELYVINESHKYMKTSSFLIDSSDVELRPIREKIIIDQDIINNNNITINEYPYNSNIEVFYNGNNLDSSLYNIVDVSGQLTINWINTTFNPVVNDIIIIDYYIIRGLNTVGDNTYDGSNIVG